MNRRYDILLLVVTLFLVAFGLAMVYSASTFLAVEQHLSPYHYLERQGIAAALGLGAMVVLARMPYRRIVRRAPAAYVVMLVLLVLVFVPGIRHSAGGASRWIGFGGFHLQPAEFVKIVVLLGLASWLHRNRADVNDARVLGLAAAAIGPALLLILAQPDFGSFAIIGGLCGVMVFCAGLRWLYVGGLGVIGALAIAIVAMAADYRVKRLTSFLDPFADCSGDGYQVCQSLLALHRGGLAGQGPGEGVAKLLYLPEPYNDFIAAVLGEELGLWGMLGLLGLYAVFAWRGISIARRSTDQLAALIATTFTVMIVGQACLNLGVVMSVVPPKGLVLPFMSYGASAMMANLAGVGVLLSVSAEAREVDAREPAAAAAVGAR